MKTKKTVGELLLELADLFRTLNDVKKPSEKGGQSCQNQ